MTPLQLRELKHWLQLARVQVDAWHQWQSSDVIDRNVRVQSCESAALTFFNQLWSCIGKQLCVQYALPEELSNRAILESLQTQQIAAWEQGWLSTFLTDNYSVLNELEAHNEAPLGSQPASISPISNSINRIPLGEVKPPLLPTLLSAFELLCSNLAQYGEEW